jgi:hypothetical protein
MEEGASVAARPDSRGAATVLGCAPVPDAAAPHECRCGCGSLLARLRPDGVELKCRRCKRLVMLTFAELSTREERELHFHG